MWFELIWVEVALILVEMNWVELILFELSLNWVWYELIGLIWVMILHVAAFQQCCRWAAFPCTGNLTEVGVGSHLSWLPVGCISLQRRFISTSSRRWRSIGLTWFLAAGHYWQRGPPGHYFGDTWGQTAPPTAGCVQEWRNEDVILWLHHCKLAFHVADSGTSVDSLRCRNVLSAPSGSGDSGHKACSWFELSLVELRLIDLIRAELLWVELICWFVLSWFEFIWVVE